jgi:hypothetical protein
MASTILFFVDFVRFIRYNTYLSGLEEQYLDRLITCRRPCKSGTRNNEKSYIGSWVERIPN